MAFIPPAYVGAEAYRNKGDDVMKYSGSGAWGGLANPLETAEKAIAERDEWIKKALPILRDDLNYSGMERTAELDALIQEATE